MGLEQSSVEYRVEKELAMTENNLVKTFFDFGLQWQVAFDITIIDKIIPIGWKNIVDIRKFELYS